MINSFFAVVFDFLFALSRLLYDHFWSTLFVLSLVKKPVKRLSVLLGEKIATGEEKGRREPVDKHLKRLFRPLVVILPTICQ